MWPIFLLVSCVSWSSLFNSVPGHPPYIALQSSKHRMITGNDTEGSGCWSDAMMSMWRWLWRPPGLQAMGSSADVAGLGREGVGDVWGTVELGEELCVWEWGVVDSQE